KAAIFRRIVRRRNHDAVRVALSAPAIVDENGPRYDGRWSDAIVALNQGFDTVCRQDLKSCSLRRIRKSVRVLAHVQRAICAVSIPVIADRLSDGEDVGFVETPRKRRASMTAGSEPHHLVGIRQIRAALEILTLQPGEVNQHLLGSRKAGEG